MLQTQLVNAAKRLIGGSGLAPVFVRLSGLDFSGPFTSGTFSDGELTIDATNSAPSGTPGGDAIDVRRADGTIDTYWTIKARNLGGASGDQIDIVWYCWDPDAGQWYPTAKTVFVDVDDYDETYGGVITIQSVAGTTHIQPHVTAVSAGMSIAVTVRGSN
jgi:hypothetical protein